MRVAFLTHYTTLYGANRSLLSLLDGLQHRQVEPIVVLPPEDDGMYEELAKRNIETVSVDVPLHFATTAKRPSWFHPIQRRRWNATRIQEVQQRTMLAAQSLADKCQTRGVDAVYSNTAATRLGHEVAGQIGKPHVWHLREFPENYGMHFVDGLAAFRRRLSQATEVIAISQSVANRLAGPSLASRCHVIYNGVGFTDDFQQLDQRRQQRTPGPTFRFLLLGQILPSKGHDQAIQAAQRLSRTYDQAFELRIVGSGQDDWLADVIARHDAGQIVTVAGPTDDPYAEIIAADCLLMCSPLEAMGRVTAEAMVAGCPVIGYDAGGTAELIDSGQTGLLYRGGYKQLAAMMQRMISDQDLRCQISHAAQQVACERFSNENYTNQVATVIAGLANRQQPTNATV